MTSREKIVLTVVVFCLISFIFLGYSYSRSTKESVNTFTVDELNMLAEADRLMDSGKMPFVVYRGNRWMVSPDVMNFFNLKNGQAVSQMIIIGIKQREIINLQNYKKKGEISE